MSTKGKGVSTVALALFLILFATLGCNKTSQAIQVQPAKSIETPVQAAIQNTHIPPEPTATSEPTKQIPQIEFESYVWGNEEDTINFNGEVTKIEVVVNELSNYEQEVMSFAYGGGDISELLDCRKGYPTAVFSTWGYREKNSWVIPPEESLTPDLITLFIHTGECSHTGPLPLENLRMAMEGDRNSSREQLDEKRKDLGSFIGTHVGFGDEDTTIWFELVGITVFTKEQIQQIDDHTYEMCLDQCSLTNKDDCLCHEYSTWMDRFFPDIETPQRTMFIQTCGASGDGSLDDKYFLMLVQDDTFSFDQ